MKTFALTTLCLMLHGGYTYAADTIHPEPGMWEQTTQLSADQTHWRTMGSSRGCLTKEQAADWDNTPRQQIAAAQCTVQSLNVAGGTINGMVTCANAYQTQMKLSGSYDGSHYDIDLVSTGTVPMPAPAGARWCPSSCMPSGPGAWSACAPDAPVPADDKQNRTA